MGWDGCRGSGLRDGDQWAPQRCPVVVPGGAQRQRAKEVKAGCLRGGVLVVAPSRCCCREQDVLGWRLWSAMWLVIDARIRNAPPNQMHPLLGSRVAPEPHTTATGAQGVAVARCWLAGNEQLGRAGRGCEWDGSHSRVVGTCNLHEHTHHGANMRAKVCGGGFSTVSPKVIRGSSAKSPGLDPDLGAHLGHVLAIAKSPLEQPPSAEQARASVLARAKGRGPIHSQNPCSRGPAMSGVSDMSGMDLNGGREVEAQSDAGSFGWCFVLRKPPASQQDLKWGRAAARPCGWGWGQSESPCGASTAPRPPPGNCSTAPHGCPNPPERADGAGKLGGMRGSRPTQPRTCAVGLPSRGNATHLDTPTTPSLKLVFGVVAAMLCLPLLYCGAGDGDG